MAAPAAPSLLPPTAVITDTNKAGIVLIVTALGLACALVSCLIRAYVRYEFSPSRFWWDDVVIGAAFLFSIFQSAAVFVEVQYGFGRRESDISARALVAIQKAMYADHILWIVALWLSKISVGALFLRLSPQFSHALVSRLNIVLAVATGVTAILIVSLRCDLSRPWININIYDAQCAGLFARWQAVAAFDMASEILLFATSVFLLSSLQLAVRKKAVISLAFAFRLLLIIPAGFHLHELSKTLNSSDATLVGVFALVCRQSELAWALTSATIPCLRPFLTATATNYGAPAEGPRSKKGPYGAYGSQQSANNMSDGMSGHALNSLTSKLRRQPHNDHQKSDIEPQPYRAPVFRQAASIESENSEQFIIHKDVSYQVEWEDRSSH